MILINKTSLKGGNMKKKIIIVILILLLIGVGVWMFLSKKTNIIYIHFVQNLVKKHILNCQIIIINLIRGDHIC